MNEKKFGASKHNDLSLSSNVHNFNDSAARQTVFGDLIKSIIDTLATNTLRVLQGGYEPVKINSSDNKKINMVNMVSPPKTHKKLPNVMEDTFERTLGLTAHAMLNDTLIASNMALRNQLSEELGGRPTTHLNSYGESVASYRRRMGKDNSSSRESRNNLKKANELASSGIADKAGRVGKRLYQKHSCENNDGIKKKIRRAMNEVQKIENGDNTSSVLNVIRFGGGQSKNDGTFFSQEAADEVLDFV